MFNIQRSIVSSFTVSKINSLSLRILDEIGIPIQSERAIEILDGRRNYPRIRLATDLIEHDPKITVAAYFSLMPKKIETNIKKG